MLDKMRLLALTLGSVAAGAAGLAGAGVAAADDTDPSVQLGQQARIVDGANIQGWTVNGLRPSSDAIPYQTRGALWEATATAEAIAGGGLPFIPGFDARTANGENYRVLFQVPTAEGVNPSPLAQGASTTGKLYFDVTGDAPTTVVFGDHLTWVQPPPETAPGGGSAARYGTGYAQQGSYAVPQGNSAAGVNGSPAAGTPATGSQGTPQAAPKTAPAAAPDDVHGAVTPAQTKPSTAPLDVHDTTAPSATAPTPAAKAPSSAAPAAPTASTPAPAAVLAAPAQPAVPTYVVPAPKPMSLTGN